MNISFKPGLVVSIWLPGFALTAFLLLSVCEWRIATLPLNTWTALGILTISLVVGQFLDTGRDAILENLLFSKMCGELKWDFFFEGDKQSIENLEEWYYMWYVLDANIVLAILVAAVLGLFHQIPINTLTWVLMAISFLLFFLDARELRTETKKMIDKYYETRMDNLKGKPSARSRKASSSAT